MTTPANAKLIVGLIVAALGDEWETIPNPHDNENYQAFVDNRTGAQFYGSTQKCDGKLRIGVHIPNNWYRNGSWPTARNDSGEAVSRPDPIKMNQDKAPEKMAKDFLNRFVNEGVSYFLKARVALDREENDAKNRLDNRKNIAKALGAEWSPYFAEHNITTKVKNIHVAANVTVSNNVELTLSYLTMEQAKRVLEILKG